MVSLLRFFLFFAIAASVISRNIMPAVLIIGPFIVPAIIIFVTLKDMDRAYVEISDQRITVADYCFGVEQKKVFSMQDIASAEILPGSSLRLRGYRYDQMGSAYIVFRDRNGKYMFKILCVPETRQYFAGYLEP